MVRDVLACLALPHSKGRERQRRGTAWLLSALLPALLLTAMLLTTPFLSACSSPERIYHPTTMIEHKLSRAEVRDVIVRCASAQGWWVDDRMPGLIKAVYRDGEQRAEIEIPYNAVRYSIRYLNSSNLRDDDSAFDEINEPYNEWVRKLDKAIHEALEALHTKLQE